jgi:energy-coupling factor transport system permease protein
VFIADVDRPGSPLASIDPVVKAAAFTVLVLAPVFHLDPVTPLAFLGLAWLGAWPLAWISPWALLWRLRGYLTLGAGIALFSVLFYDGAASDSVLVLGPLRLSPEGASFGAAIGLRLVCMVTYTYLFFITTEPTRLVNSLTVNARVPYRLSFTILAAYRFLPLLQTNLVQIGEAQRIRNVNRPRRGRLVQTLAHSLVPLLTGGMRHAERLALAMDARGFGAASTRTCYVVPALTRKDAVFLVSVLVIAATLLLALAHLDLMSGWLAGASESLAVA